MDFLSSKKVSLFCGILNGAFAAQSFAQGSWLWGLICVIFCVFCLNNWRNAKE
tara:strand:+ start:10114 stop:10272 length:159 start_codon:yes stop_codon:yes gene_type:complete